MSKNRELKVINRAEQTLIAEAYRLGNGFAANWSNGRFESACELYDRRTYLADTE